MDFQTTKPRKLFLLDACGALVSAFFLAVILPYFEWAIGMPTHILYLLASAPVFFAMLSLFCYFNMTEKWHQFMKIIASLNLSYCLITFMLLLYFFPQLSLLARGYFIVEILLVVALALVEWKTASN